MNGNPEQSSAATPSHVTLALLQMRLVEAKEPNVAKALCANPRSGLGRGRDYLLARTFLWSLPVPERGLHAIRRRRADSRSH